jgi:hypothetical protein
MFCRVDRDTCAGLEARLGSACGVMQASGACMSLLNVLLYLVVLSRHTMVGSLDLSVPRLRSRLRLKRHECCKTGMRTGP